MQNIIALKSKLATAWRDLKNEKLNDDMRKAAYADIVTLSEQVSKLDPDFKMNTEMLKKYENLKSKEIIPRVVWPEYDSNGQFKDLEEFFDKITTLAVKIVHKRLPRESQDSEKFGMIVSATTDKLIALMRTPPPSKTLI